MINKTKRTNLSLTIIANTSANGAESIGNISEVQKIVIDGKVHAIRTRESAKNAILECSGLHDSLSVVATGKGSKVAQKEVDTDKNAGNNYNHAISGYMATKEQTGGANITKKSPLNVSDMVLLEPFVNPVRFGNNIGLANIRKEELLKSGKSIKDAEADSGLMPRNREVAYGISKYSTCIFLEELGIDKNFRMELSPKDKISVVNCFLDGIQTLSTCCRGELMNSSPLFIIGGISQKTVNPFECLVKVQNNKIILSEDAKYFLKNEHMAIAIVNGIFDNEEELRTQYNIISIPEFFDKMKKEIEDYYLGE
jgi:CRISPR-associated protein Cst2